MIDSGNALIHGTAVGSTALGVYGVVTASNLQAIGLSVVAIVGGLLSVAMTAYGSYRKINRENGVDEIKAANAKLKDLQEQCKRQNDIITRQSAELIELVKTQNEMIQQLNIHTSAVASNTTPKEV